MARYENRELERDGKDGKVLKTTDIHPVWRGIGFVMIILTPIIAYASTLLLLDLNNQNRWYAIPRDLLVSAKDPYLLVKVISTVVISILIFLVYQLITFFLYRITGPSRYGPMDVPPVRYTGKKFKR